MQEPTDHAQEEDQWDEEYEEGEDEEYEDYDAPQVGDMIVTVGEDNDAWDDTALIEAWDEAVKEYQAYHSTANPDDPPFSSKGTSKPAKGAAATQQQEHTPQTKKRPPPVPAEKELTTPTNANNSKRAKSSSTKSQTIAKQTNAVKHDTQATPTEAESQAAWYQYQNYWSHQDNATPPPPPPPPVQESAAAAGEDEALSNLMMAWYYSGYYTGYYQAMRRR
ncbi:hypothetical protein Unana1_01565 [Umbelopsis nana]